MHLLTDENIFPWNKIKNVFHWEINEVGLLGEIGKLKSKYVKDQKKNDVIPNKKNQGNNWSGFL